MVTNKMLEILVGVARMPSEYRKLRQKELVADYECHLTCSYALEAFNFLIGRESEIQLSEKGRATVRAATRLAGRERELVSQEGHCY